MPNKHEQKYLGNFYNSEQNRNRIKGADTPIWLTVPVNYRFPQRIDEVAIDKRKGWQRKHINSLEINYSSAPYFSRYFPQIKKIIESEFIYLKDLNIALIMEIMSILGMEKKTAISSGLGELPEDPDERLISICAHFGADTYIAGAGGRNYMNLEKYEEAGIKVFFQEYEHPVYRQQYGGFLSHLSVVDLLFNCGPESLSIIKGENL